MPRRFSDQRLPGASRIPAHPGVQTRRDSMAKRAPKKPPITRFPELDEPLRKAQRYAVIFTPRWSHVELFDERFVLDSFMAWRDLWCDIKLSASPPIYAEYEAQAAKRSAGPTLTEDDHWLLTYLTEAAQEWGDERLEAKPSDPTVAEH